MSEAEVQNLEEIKLAYKSHADMQWVLEQLAAARAEAEALRERAEVAEDQNALLRKSVAHALDTYVEGRWINTEELSAILARRPERWDGVGQ